jgi:hypothetical protein
VKSLSLLLGIIVAVCCGTVVSKASTIRFLVDVGDHPIGSLDTLQNVDAMSLREALCDSPAVVSSRHYVQYQLKLPAQERIIVIFGRYVAEALVKAGSLVHPEQAAHPLTATDSLSVAVDEHGAFDIELPPRHLPIAVLYCPSLGPFAFIKW